MEMHHADVLAERRRTKEQQRELYEQSPSRCTQCSNSLSFRKRKAKFCSQSCAATFNNTGRVRTEESKQLISIITKAYYDKVGRVHPKCKKCHEELCEFDIKHNHYTCWVCLTQRGKHIRALKFGLAKRTPVPSQKYKPRTPKKYHCIVCTTQIHKGKYCNSCIPYVRLYRHRAKFKFNVYDYPDRFDLTLLEEYGWYKPGGKSRGKETNLGGVSRDHMYSVADGFKNQIDPAIIAHPANCKLMLHSENNSKNTESEITIEELYQRIEVWDNTPTKEQALINKKFKKLRKLP